MMSLDDFYINSSAAKKRGNIVTYNRILKDLFGKVLSWSEVENLPKNDQMKLMLDLDKQIKINKSPYDIKKLTRAIQHSRSGAGGCAITHYECKFCGSEESWGNTATPGICYSCAEKMARKIVIYGMDLNKD